MNQRLEILLVEDDECACKELIDEIDNCQEDYCLIGKSNNSAQAFEILTESQPDAVILDLELHQGGGDGLDFLKKVQNSGFERPPFILITTNNISAFTHKTARALGADFIVTKNQDGYSAKYVLDLLKTAKDVILSRKSSQKASKNASETTQAQKRISRQVNNELLKVGVNPKSVGFKYLIDAILITIQSPVPHICNIIGKKYGKTENSVERAMQNAINRAWNTSDINDLLVNYTAKINSEKGMPTITEFIFFYAQKIKNNI